MTSPKPSKPSLGGLGRARRRAVSIGTEDLVREHPLAEGGELPWVIEPGDAGLQLVGWSAENRALIAERLARHGGVLFRGFHLGGDDAFEAFMRAVVGRELLDYSYRSTPRKQVKGKVYTSTEYPAERTIPMHNEMSYTTTWPRKIWFHCVRPAEQGGETPIADSARVYDAVDPALRERFAARGVLYVRNYGEGLDLPWQEVFQTEDRAQVEAACRQRSIEWEWLGGDRLRTRQRCQGVARHPDTGAPLWFNQAHLFHVSSTPEELRRALLDAYGEEGLPRHAYYGDGTPIEEHVIASIREAYDRNLVTFPWQEGDVLMLDNMQVAHGRNPFSGSRRIVVGMAEPWTGTEP